MIVDGRPVSTRRLKDLVGDTGKVWLGTITLDDHGRRVQDVEVRGIRPERYSQAIKIAGCRTRPRNRGASPEVMARLRAAKKLNPALDKTPSFAPESRGEAREGVNHYPAQDEAIGASLACGKAPDTTPPAAGASGALCAPARAILRRDAALPGVATMPPASGYRPHAAQTEAPTTMPPAMAAPPAAFTQKFAPRTPRQNISASKCSGGNFITDWRVK